MLRAPGEDRRSAARYPPRRAKHVTFVTSRVAKSPIPGSARCSLVLPGLRRTNHVIRSLATGSGRGPVMRTHGRLLGSVSPRGDGWSGLRRGRIKSLEGSRQGRRSTTTCWCRGERKVADQRSLAERRRVEIDAGSGSPPRLTGPSWNVGQGSSARRACYALGGGDQVRAPDVRDLTVRRRDRLQLGA